MNQQPKDSHPKPVQTPPFTVEEINRQKQKAEEQEVAGRHKNDGAKDHKGAR